MALIRLQSFLLLLGEGLLRLLLPLLVIRPTIISAAHWIGCLLSDLIQIIRVSSLLSDHICWLARLLLGGLRLLLLRLRCLFVHQLIAHLWQSLGLLLLVDLAAVLAERDFSAAIVIDLPALLVLLER